MVGGGGRERVAKKETEAKVTRKKIQFKKDIEFRTSAGLSTVEQPFNLRRFLRLEHC